jgi:hypothetical protein
MEATPEELRQATKLLRRLKPSDFVGDDIAPELVALRDAAKELFARGILQERFGERDAVRSQFAELTVISAIARQFCAVRARRESSSRRSPGTKRC